MIFAKGYSDYSIFRDLLNDTEFSYSQIALIVRDGELDLVVSPILRNFPQYGGFFCYMENGIKRCRSPPSENLIPITQFKFSEVYYGRQRNQARIQ